MPREDHCRVISPHDHPLKALNHGAVVTTREIRSADGAGEENVTAEHDRGIVGLSRTREDNRPLGVTGGMRHDEADASKCSRDATMLVPAGSASRYLSSPCM